MNMIFEDSQNDGTDRVLVFTSAHELLYLFHNKQGKYHPWHLDIVVTQPQESGSHQKTKLELCDQTYKRQRWSVLSEFFEHSTLCWGF